MRRARTVLAVRVVLGTTVAAALGAGACQSTYYKMMEAVGKEKRDLLVGRVQDARAQQEEAKEQFGTALDRFSELVHSDGGDLRKAYDRAKSELERSESKAEGVRGKIDSVETVAKDLFSEWETELKQYSSDELRRNSQRQLDTTRNRYDQMIGAMRKAEASMEPVLGAFRDQVLSLKHNLNAQAVAALQGNVADLEREIADLIREMEASMAEADRFVKQLEQGA